MYCYLIRHYIIDHNPDLSMHRTKYFKCCVCFFLGGLADSPPKKKQWGFITARFLHTLIVLSISVRIESHLGGHWNFCFFRFNLFLELCVWSTIPSRGDDNREIHLLWIHA